MFNSPFTLVFLSAVLWAMQPAFILAAGRAVPEGALAFLILNTMGTAAVALGVLVWKSSRARIAAAFSVRRTRREFALLILLDAVFVALSYLLLALAAAQGNLAASAIFFESWPIFVALMLFACAPQAGDRNLPVLMALVLFIIGLLLIQKGEGTAAARLISFEASLPVLSALCMAIGVFATQIFMRRNRKFHRFDNFLLVVAARAVATTLFLGVFALVSAALGDGGGDVAGGGDGRAAGLAALGPEYLAASILFGMLVFANTALYHLGVARASSNAVALVALLSPVLAPIFLFAIGLGVPSIEFFMGAAFVVAGLSVTARTRDNTAQFQILLFVMLAAGTAIVFIDGLGVANYYLYIQATAVFYGLFQTSALSRLYERYLRTKRLSIELYEVCRARAVARDPVAFAIAKRELRGIKAEVSSVSELLLLTLFAVANVLLAIAARDNSLEGDTIAYVITVASSFMVLICWYYQFRIMSMTPFAAARLSRRPSNVLLARSLSYVVSTTLFFWLFFVIFFKHQPFATP